MTESEIATLAREYAEEMNPIDFYEGGNIAERNADLRIDKENAELFFEWLTRRYCLVEKEKAKQFFQSRQNILANQDKYDRYIVDEASAEKRLMLCLFPEITKEAEK